MNRNYKVIWSEALNCFIAVAEYAKGHSKSSSTVVQSSSTIEGVRSFRFSRLRSGLAAASLTGLALTLSAPVLAATNVAGGIGSGTAVSACTGTQQANSGNNLENIAIGCSSATSNTGLFIADRGNPYYTDNVTNSATVNAADRNAYTPRGEEGGSVAIGTGSKTERTFGVALGEYATTTNIAGVAIGTGSLSKGNTALALGRQSVATGDYSQAIGNVSAATGKGSLAVGHSATATGYRAIAIGATDIDGASASYGQSSANYQAVGQTKATADDTIAFGSGAQATADNALAFGASATATSAGSVAIGTGSTTAVNANSVTSATINGTTYNNFAGSTAIAAGDQISVGASGQERQVKNVAAGNVTAISTDAINGSQLYSVADTLSSSITNNTTNITKNADNINKGISFGNGITENNFALGSTITVVGDNNLTSVTTASGVQVQLSKELTGLNSATFGDVIISTSGLDNGGNIITNVASGGTTTTNAANIGDVQAAAAGSRTQVAAGSNVTDVIKTTGDNGQDIYTVNANGASVSTGSTALTVTAGTKNASNVTDYAVDLSQASKDSLVKADSAMQTITTQVDGVNVKTINQASNTANFVTGDNIVLSNDNGSIKVATAQNLVATSIKTGDTTINNNGLTIENGASITTNGIDAGNRVITNVADGVNTNDAASVGQLNTIDSFISGQIATIDRNINAMGYRIGEVEDDANAGISAAMAMSSLPQAYIPGKSMVGGGIASYNGESAVAIGVSRVSDDGRWVMKINGTADTQGNAGGAIGAGFHF